VHTISGDTSFADITKWPLARLLLKALGFRARPRSRTPRRDEGRP